MRWPQETKPKSSGSEQAANLSQSQLSLHTFSMEQNLSEKIAMFIAKDNINATTVSKKEAKTSVTYLLIFNIPDISGCWLEQIPGNGSSIYSHVHCMPNCPNIGPFYSTDEFNSIADE